MLVKHLTLASFRNYGTLEVAFEPGINLIIGPNGQGKTNMVEAVRYMSVLSSHRVAGYQPLINSKANSAIVRAMVSSEERDVLLEIELNREGKNKARVNKADLPRIRDIIGIVQSVTFAPEDIDIVRRDPTNRRAFIDELVVQHRPRMAGVYADYERVLKQRNALLKSAKITKTTGSALSTLDAWDASLVQYGTEIVSARLNIAQLLQPHLFDAYQKIATSNNEPRLVYRSSLLVDTAGLLSDSPDVAEDLAGGNLENLDRDAIAAMFSAKLAEIRPKELERGITLAGPQRDDIILMLGDLPAKGYASHGEMWSYALALRLASIELLKTESRTGDPVLILDDVFAELDAGRRLRLAELIANNEQVLITAAAEEDVPAILTATRFAVKQAVVTRV
jgi:DNA replication and repair protein RecF